MTMLRRGRREVRRTRPLLVGLGYAAILIAATLLGALLVRGLNHAVQTAPVPTEAPARMRSTSVENARGSVETASARLAHGATATPV